jgi:hypothetical protein
VIADDEIPRTSAFSGAMIPGGNPQAVGAKKEVTGLLKWTLRQPTAHQHAPASPHIL